MSAIRRKSFRDRLQAGRLLAARLAEMDLDDPVVKALPRGGVPVGFEVAKGLAAPLDVGLVRKLGHPGQPELALGAIGEDGTIVVDERAMNAYGISRERIEAIARAEGRELERRRLLYRERVPALDVRGRTVVVVDDGIATGLTATAACRLLGAQGAARVILAVPVCPADWPARAGDDIDTVVALHEPIYCGSVGAWYDDFDQTTDEEVVRLLTASRQ